MDQQSVVVYLTYRYTTRDFNIAQLQSSNSLKQSIDDLFSDLNCRSVAIMICAKGEVPRLHFLSEESAVVNLSSLAFQYDIQVIDECIRGFGTLLLASLISLLPASSLFQRHEFDSILE